MMSLVIKNHLLLYIYIIQLLVTSGKVSVLCILHQTTSSEDTKMSLKEWTLRYAEECSDEEDEEDELNSDQDIDPVSCSVVDICFHPSHLPIFVSGLIDSGNLFIGDYMYVSVCPFVYVCF